MALRGVRKAPLVIPVQVYTRYSRWVLVVLIVCGLGFGFFTRSILKPKIETGEAVQRAAELAAAMRSDELKGDSKFRREVASARAALKLVSPDSR